MIPSSLHPHWHRPRQSLLSACWRQWRTEQQLARRGVRFRSTDPNELRNAYSAMTASEFEAINSRQNWANWRTIPRALEGLLPLRPLLILDLGCGTGDSTAVLAELAPPGSIIIGFELAAPLLEIARKRQYRHHNGRTANVQFRSQAVTTTLHAPDGAPIPEASVDLVNASGLVGHHFRLPAAFRLADELSRVMAPSGIAVLDVGPALSARQLTHVMTRFGFEKLRRRKSCFVDPTGQVVFRKRAD